LSFGSPWLLLSLVLVPVAILGYRALERRRAARAAAWSRPAMLPNIVGRRPQRLRHIPVVLFLIGLTFLLVGFARPQRNLGKVHGSAATIVLTFDVSGSMAANDVPPTRIRAARSLALQILKALPSRFRVGVVTFGTEVHLAVAPTFDRKSVIAALPDAVTPHAGTRIGDGIGQAVSTVVEAVGQGYPGDPTRLGEVLLFSDGVQTAGGPTPAEAANVAFLNGVPVSTVAVGTQHGSVTQQVKVDGFSTPAQFMVPVYPAGLSQVASATGGQAFVLRSQSDLTTVSKALAKVDRTLGSSSAPGQRKHELSTVTAEIALLFILGAVVLSAFWFGTVV
jgi:Ca-activated chloride channel homolog